MGWGVGNGAVDRRGVSGGEEGLGGVQGCV